MVNGEKISGLGILDLWTIAGTKRLIGNVVVELNGSFLSTGMKDKDDGDCGPTLGTMVGFENHSGKTYLGKGVRPLGKVLVGHGNNDQDQVEGVRYRNVFGTYLHGPLLPKNPHLADLLLELALMRRGYDCQLMQLDDRLEHLAHEAMVGRLMKQA